MKCSYKKICALILTLVMALSVTGCTDDSASSLPEEKPSVYPFVNTLKEPEDNTRKMLQSISSILDILQSDSFTPQEKNAALKSIVEKITYDRANSHIDVDFYLTENPEMPANP